jgi:hypothetical protein
MTTKKQKREQGIARREAFEAEERARHAQQLRVAQEGRKAEREAADKKEQERKIEKSKALAKKHAQEKKHRKQGVTEHKPTPRPTLQQILLLGAVAEAARTPYDSGL